MVSHLFFYQLTLIALVWLCLMLQWVWPSDPTAMCPTTPEPPPPVPKRHRERTPFAGRAGRCWGKPQNSDKMTCSSALSR